MSTRGRKPAPEPAAPADTLDRQALAEDSAALTEVSRRSMEVAERFGDGTPYERGRIVSEARFYMAAGAEAMLELGKRLVQIKENEPHGDFTRIVTEQLGIGERSARLMMAAAVRFLAPASKRQALAVLGKTKLFDLMAESDEDLDALAEGGTLAGLELDDMQAMTSRELKDALAAARKTLAAKDAVIAKKDEKINRLAEAAELRRGAGPDALQAEQLEALRSQTIAAESALDVFLATVDELMENGATEAVKLSARHGVDYVVQRMVDMCLERRITVNLDTRVSPLHMRDVEAIAAAAPAARGSRKRA